VEDGKILLVSGLDLVNNTDELSLDLLSEWITGMVGYGNAQKEEAVVARVIIAGENKMTKIYSYSSGHSFNLVHILYSIIILIT